MRAAGRGRANGTALYTIMTSTPLSRSARRQLGVFIYLHDAEKKKAVKLWKAVQDANPTSLTSQRKRMAEREAKHVAKRTKDVETHGDDSKIERDVLNANREALTKDGVLVFLDGVYGSTDYYVHYEFTKSRGAIHFHSILFSLHEAYVRENID